MINIDIDLVYLWVDGNDSSWIAKRNAFMGTTPENEGNCKGRYADNDELKYSLRSIEKNAPWIRNIFIVTDNQVPKWLDTSNPKIKIIDHTDILPSECLPCFNSVILEHHLHKIPGLSEYFLYANDDLFINKPVSPETFFTEDLQPIIRMNRRMLKKWLVLYKEKVLGRRLHIYSKTIHNAALLVEKKFGVFFNSKTHHNIDAYKKSTYAQTREMFDEEIRKTLCNHMRSSNDIQRNLYSYVALATKQGHLCYVNKHTSFYIPVDNRESYKKFLRYNPMLFCMNDSQHCSDEDRAYATEFISRLFPEKSQFEK